MTLTPFLGRGFLSFSPAGIKTAYRGVSMANMKKNADGAQQEVVPQAIMDQIEKVINSTLHGSVTLIVQDSRIIQIERVEKIRLC